jgi:hypothetical protein
MTKPLNGTLKWGIGITGVIALSIGGGSVYTSVHRVDDRQTDARVRNTEGIALNATILATHGERIRALEECMRHVRKDIGRLDGKVDRVLAAVE